MKVLAKDAKAGQWYEDRNGRRIICVGGDRRFVREVGDVFCLWNDEELTHLPDCTDWDWQPPKPEKKYRPFANAAEYMPHRGRWVYLCNDISNQLFINSFDNQGIWYANRTTRWGEMFAQAKFADDNTPFGVEVTE